MDKKLEELLSKRKTEMLKFIVDRIEKDLVKAAQKDNIYSFIDEFTRELKEHIYEIREVVKSYNKMKEQGLL